ncbi:MAG: shikimate kinase [Bacillota bacterium]
MDRNIILIGMPGSGKSTLGVLLAKQMGYGYVDSDVAIQQRCGKRLSELLCEKGFDGFVSIEGETNTFLAKSLKRTVIATGGSAVYNEQAMQALCESGICVYLEVSLPTLRHRLGDYSQRGVALPNGYTLEDLFCERDPLYRKYARVTLSENPEISMQEVVRNLEKLIADCEK